MTAPQNLMLNGQVIRMIGTILADLNNGTVAANKVFQNILDNKFSFIKSVADAIRSAGNAQAMGQLIMGIVGTVGGAASIIGGVIGIGSAMGEASALQNIGEGALEDNISIEMEEINNPVEEEDSVGMEDMSEPNEVRVRLEEADNEEGPSRENVENEEVRAQAREEQERAQQNNTDRDNNRIDANRKSLSTAEKQLKQKEIEAQWASKKQLAQTLTTLAQPLQGVGQGAESYFTHLSAQFQAIQQQHQGLSDISGQQMSSTESAQQNTQSFFSQTAGLASQYMQYVVALSQAH
jgi:hypothetical protein